MWIRAALVILILACPSWAHATKVFEINFDTQTCDTAPTDGGKYDGVCYDYYDTTPYVRCSPVTPITSANYFECQTGASPNNCEIDFFRGVSNCTGTAYTVGTSATYYLAAFVRFERIGGNAIWQDDSAEENSFDKLIDITGTAFRLGIYAGWPQGRYTAVQNKFTFDLWAGMASGMPNFGCFGGADNSVQNVSPYSSASPYLADYEKWYAVVMEVTPKTDNTGSIRLYVNGTKIVENTGCQSSETGATMVVVQMWGTIAQPAYDAPAHKRQADHILITDTYQDVVDGGYMQDPESGSSPVYRKLNNVTGVRVTLH